MRKLKGRFALATYRIYHLRYRFWLWVALILATWGLFGLGKYIWALLAVVPLVVVTFWLKKGSDRLQTVHKKTLNQIRRKFGLPEED